MRFVFRMKLRQTPEVEYGFQLLVYTKHRVECQVQEKTHPNDEP